MKKICMVCDIPNWAFDNIAKELKKRFDNKYEINIEYYDMKAEPDNLYELIEKNNDCDLIHFFWRKSLLQIEAPAFREKVEASGRNFEEYLAEKRKKISTGVFDFLYIDENSVDVYKKIFNEYTGYYWVNSQKLYNEYMNIPKFSKPHSVVHDICNFENFKPANLERFDSVDRELVVGWVGNSIRLVDGVDLKGFNTIIKPVIAELQAEGYNIKEHYADRNDRWRTIEEMPMYYSEIDLCICTSIHEGTPMPVLEAMSCGVPLITTDVGIVREAFGDKQKRYIIGDREKGKNDEKIKIKLKEKIVELYNNRKMLKELSEENQVYIEKYDGGKIIKEYEEFFDYCLENS